MTSTKLTDTINKLRQLTQLDIQDNWLYCLEDLPIEVATRVDNWNRRSLVSLTPKNTISWSSGRQVLWLGQQLSIPPSFQDYPLPGLVVRLSLTWWAELAQVFVNGQQYGLYKNY